MVKEKTLRQNLIGPNLRPVTALSPFPLYLSRERIYQRRDNAGPTLCTSWRWRKARTWFRRRCSSSSDVPSCWRWSFQCSKCATYLRRPWGTEPCPHLACGETWLRIAVWLMFQGCKMKSSTMSWVKIECRNTLSRFVAWSACGVEDLRKITKQWEFSTGKKGRKRIRKWFARKRRPLK